MFAFTRRTPAPAPADEGVSAPTTADVRLDQALISHTGVVSVPHWWDHVRAIIAGRQDGRHGLLPDPECGHTQHTARIADQFATVVGTEQVKLSRTLSRADELCERLTTEARQLRRDVEDLSGQSIDLGELDERVAPELAARRRDRDCAARQAAHRDRIEAMRSRIDQIERELAGLAMLRTHQITATAQLIDRARVTRQQLVDVYWRWFVRLHPEESAVRAGYPIPSVDRPAVTAATEPPRH